jgi:hypothetical protein
MSASITPKQHHNPPRPLYELLHAYAPALGADRESWCITPLPGDGSDRGYYRCKHAASGRTLIGVDGRAKAAQTRKVHGHPLSENHSFMLIGRHLAAGGIPVPKVHVTTPDAACYLLDDLGDTTLATRVAACRGNAPVLASLYKPAIDLLVTIQLRASPGFRPMWCFAGGIYDTSLVINQELGYFLRAGAIDSFGLTVSPRIHRVLQREFRRLAAHVVRQAPRGIMLRDFQSRNLMLHVRRLFVIDFQGARRGPLHYDLAGLLHDPYVDLPAELRTALARRYRDAAVAAGLLSARQRQTFFRDWQQVSFVRLLQVVGALCFLGRVKRRPGFIEHLPAAIRTAKQLAAETALGRTAPTLCSLVATLPWRVPPARVEMR